MDFDAREKDRRYPERQRQYRPTPQKFHVLKNTLALSDYRAQPAQWIVFLIDHALLHRNNRVVGDANVLWADLGAALGDVAHSQAVLFLRGLLAVAQDIQWVHIEFGDTNKEARSSKGLLILFVIANNVAGVLTQEALDALTEFLAALHIDLLHTWLAWLHADRWLERRNFHRLLVVEGDVGDQVLNDWECSQWCDGDGLFWFK